MRSSLDIEVLAHARPEDALRGSDIVACCTNSNRKEVLAGAWLEPGMHLTTVLGAELGQTAAQRIDHAVKNQPVRDLRNHFSVAGQPPDGVVPRPQGWKPPAVTAEMPLLSDLVLGKASGRSNDGQITYFSNNEGTGIQFASCGAAVLESLAQRNFEGVAKVPLECFIEDIRD